MFKYILQQSFPVLWKLQNSLSEVIYFFICVMSLNVLEIFSIDHCIHFCMSFNSCLRPQLGCLQAGRRSETLKEDVTLSTTSAEALHGPGPSFRYKVGFLIGIDWGQMYVY